MRVVRVPQRDELRAAVDYRRKRGLLEEINRARAVGRGGPRAAARDGPARHVERGRGRVRAVDIDEPGDGHGAGDEPRRPPPTRQAGAAAGRPTPPPRRTRRRWRRRGHAVRAAGGRSDLAPIGPIAPLLGEILVAPLRRRAGVDRARARPSSARRAACSARCWCACKLIDEDQLALALALQLDMPYLRDLPRAEDIPAELIDKLPINFARQRLVLPLGRDGRRPRDGRGRRSARGRRDRRGRGAARRAGRAGRRVGRKIVDHINKIYARLRGGAELEETARRTTTRRARSSRPRSSSTSSTPTTRRRSSAGSTR